jgi:putative endopeptidase
MNKLLKTIKPAQWQSYLQWHVVRANAGSLSKAFVDESFALEQKLLGTPTQRVRYKRCIESTDAALGDLLAQPFIKTRFGGGSKEAVEGMVAEIGKVFGDQLDQVDWMDAPTRERGHKKLKAIAYLIGYPKTWINYTYSVDGKDHAKNTLAAHAFETHRRLARIGKPLDREAWEMSAPTVNAYYHPNKNHMVFPAGILQPPFYNPKATVAVNMGGMGMVVGHELTHGFDDEGSQFAWNGNLENWWEPPVREKFEKKTGCVVDQYGKYEPLPEAKVDGKLTLGENIADMGGVRLAFEAYRRMRKDAKEQIVADGFSEDQQFFLALGQLWCMKGREEYVRNAVKLDPHSPPKFRVNGPLTNFPAFAKAFQCDPGTKMAPINRCEVW